ncbi:hypothetical protein ACQPUZ_00365 [Clostridium tertium]
MAQIRNEKIEMCDTPDKECRICKEKKEKSIFYSCTDENLLYVCEDCFGVIEALFIDVLLEKEDKYNIKPSVELKRIEEKISRIKKTRSEKIRLGL